MALAAVAARAQSGMHELVPIDPQDADVPGWFGTRLDDVYVDIHQRLRARVAAP